MFSGFLSSILCSVIRCVIILVVVRHILSEVGFDIVV